MANKRKVVFANNEIYHVYNRSVGNQEIFHIKKEFERGLNLIDYYRFPQKIKFSEFKKLNPEKRERHLEEIDKLNPYVEIFAFCFMPDHYHLLVKQLFADGIKTFVSNFQNAFAKYFNKKHDRSGSLFRNPFKAKWIESDSIFTHISRYIHLNPVTSYIIEIKDLPTYPGTSYRFYTEYTRGDLVNTRFLLKTFGSRVKYLKFVENQSEYQRKLHIIKNFTLE